MPTKSAELLHAISPGILHPNHAGFIAGGGRKPAGFRPTPRAGFYIADICAVCISGSSPSYSMLKRVRTAREEKTKVGFVKVLPGIFFGTSMLPINVLLRLFVV